VTTTTVRCTGSAAPYAVQAAQPQTIIVPAPAPVPPPAPPAQPVVAVPAPPPIILLPRGLDGWRIVQTPDGRLWRERKISSDSPAVWGTGLAFWLASYGAATIAGTATGEGFGWLPIMGAWINASFTRGTEQILWAADGIAQAGGFVAFLVGLASGPDKVRRLPLQVGPTGFVGGAQGLAISGRF
jgi:hypothetical protein